MSLVERDDVPLCRFCSCTNLEACADGCFWVEPDLCSRCATALHEDLAGEDLEDYEFEYEFEEEDE